MASEEGAQLGEFFGVKPEDLPILRIVSPSREERYKYHGDVKTSTVEDYTKFINDFKQGLMAPYYMSEEIPEVATVDGLTTIVGKSYDELVN